MEAVEPDAGRGAARHRLGRSQDRPPLDADQQGPRRGRARRHVAARKGRRDHRPPHRRPAQTGHRTYALWLGKENPHHQSLAAQVLRPVRQYSGLSILRVLAHERTGRDVSRRDRPDLMHRLELSRLRHRERGQPRRGVLAQLSPGLHVGEVARVAGRYLLSARALRHLLRQLQGNAHLPDAVGRIA